MQRFFVVVLATTVEVRSLHAVRTRMASGRRRTPTSEEDQVVVGNAFIAVDDGWSGDAVVRLVATGTEVGRIPATTLRSALRTWGCVEDIEQLWAGTSRDKVFIYGKRGEEWTCVLRADRPKAHGGDEGSPAPS